MGFPVSKEAGRALRHRFEAPLRALHEQQQDAPIWRVACWLVLSEISGFRSGLLATQEW